MRQRRLRQVPTTTLRDTLLDSVLVGEPSYEQLRRTLPRCTERSQPFEVEWVSVDEARHDRSALYVLGTLMVACYTPRCEFGTWYWEHQQHVRIGDTEGWTDSNDPTDWFDGLPVALSETAVCTDVEDSDSDSDSDTITNSDSERRAA